jgi:hypothetical protein
LIPAHQRTTPRCGSVDQRSSPADKAVQKVYLL